MADKENIQVKFLPLNSSLQSLLDDISNNVTKNKLKTLLHLCSQYSFYCFQLFQLMKSQSNSCEKYDYKIPLRGYLEYTHSSVETLFFKLMLMVIIKGRNIICMWHTSYMNILYHLSNLPGRSMWFPRAKTHPAKFCFTVLVTTDHVITTAILLNCDMAFGTFLWKKTIELVSMLYHWGQKLVLDFIYLLEFIHISHFKK